ncbi:MAG: EAL domain-containing protein [Burkholderiales bacterium]|nr:MAG: EAL domain-containing protein [Burkholderiales bacterium]
MSPFWKHFERAGRDRGTTAVLELAAFAALWPYISGSWTRIEPAFALLCFALSLLGTLVLLVALRATLQGIPGTLGSRVHHPLDRSATVITHADEMTTATSAGSVPDMAALLDHVGTHEAAEGSGALGVVRFANHAPMVAFDALGARWIMETFGQRLKGAAGRRFVAKLGEDSFGIWFEGQARDAAEELKSIGYVLAQELSAYELTVLPDIHVNLSRYPAEGHTAKSFVAHAIGSCTPLKSFVASATPDAASPESGPGYRFALEQALRRAVRAGELSLRYQPLIDAAAGKVVGAEVLLRWRHPGFGDVSPGLFIPILEKTGLIHEIGLWTLNSACRQLSLWRAAGHPDIKLAINLSTVQLQEPDLKSSITRIVASHGLVPSDVELELTETAAMENREATVAMFHDLRALGFGIAIDDFGNGHSNFTYLRSLPFSKLKIDREFIAHVDTQPGSQAICKSLVELGAGLGITILAEGVERFEEVITLRRLGCHLFQGYYFERPQTAADFTARLADASWLKDLSSDVHRARSEVKKRMSS